MQLICNYFYNIYNEHITNAKKLHPQCQSYLVF